ncbi:MAG: MaoC family dehydratase N-terminal domain-containing protein [Alphaproteobacteria bacterium]|nr:MaoC family dehydratase N-terminal domain-containing protein [Alphaproteobacteria bacterium]MDE1986465.1 MaoC family dehydratase N-terminal domain-containing protein [Alphaproteobacteria bacterium]MDE2163823.1 MaoC family dehydratase N-terminal domain-containing protein [Alphaproteobacteria bacterium]MDE2266819.1 MaoC family dehydratase N-terminal domain-containing protein [Alphaproteobacteria bacterium]MDE2498842.1 MaoC family dehydratase N-terminal domain-containing protein [Alphaproteobac
MPINYDEIMQLKSVGDTFRYTDREAMLYALGVGFMRDPMNAQELKYVYENDLQTVPTFATVIGWGQATLARSGINYLMVVHGEQRLTMHKPLPFEAEVIADERVVGAVDKGEGKGALILMEKVIREKKSGDKLCTLGSTIFARGDGGFGGPKDGAPVPHTLPTRAPDLEVSCDTRPDQAFLYALSGDRNPLHRDPSIAKMAGYPRPILHGLCTYGTACRAVISSVCKYDAKKITGFDARFSAPVFPGETIVTEMWVDGSVVSFRCRLKERDAVVLNNGKCTLAA